MRRTCADKNDILAFSQYPYANNASIFSRLYLEKCTFLLQTCLFINHYALPDYICTHQQIALLKYEKCKGTWKYCWIPLKVWRWHESLDVSQQKSQYVNYHLWQTITQVTSGRQVEIQWKWFQIGIAEHTHTRTSNEQKYLIISQWYIYGAFWK